jgi:hypothetical protein
VGRAYTISVIVSLSRRCCAGTTTVKTSGGGYPFYPLISATDMPLIPTGTLTATPELMAVGQRFEKRWEGI